LLLLHHILTTMEGFTHFEAGVIGPTQILLIAVVIILLFGAKRIPDLMKGIGKGMREFKDATRGEEPQNKDKVEN
jgi:sec-independent protein translocase protein TatA